MKRNNLKERLSSAAKKTKEMTLNTLRCAAEYLAIVAVLAMLCVGVLKAPEAHNHWLRSKVGSRVYYIQDQADGGGGTGSAVVAPSGTTYILTNDHVCGVSKDGQTVLVTDEAGRSMRRRILAHDGYSDLCLVEGLPGVEGLKIAGSEPSIGDTLTTVGHPLLMPLTTSRGEFISKEDILVMDGPIAVVNPRTGEDMQIDPKQGGVTPEQCSLPKNKIITEDLDFGFFMIKVKFCLIEVKQAYNTNMVIRPGNSGSPVVNMWGNVEGVAFAGDSENWGKMVSLSDVMAFLKNY